MASFLWVTYPGKKKDGEWSHSLGDVPRKDDGLIVMGDLPKWKRGRVVSFLWVTYPRGGMASFLLVTYPGKQKMENGLILWVTYPEKNGGLIVMGEQPKWKE